MRLKELAEARVRYGYRRLDVLLQREGWQINYKRIYRLYRGPVDPYPQPETQAGVAPPVRSLRGRRHE